MVSHRYYSYLGIGCGTPTDESCLYDTPVFCEAVVGSGRLRQVVESVICFTNERVAMTSQLRTACIEADRYKHVATRLVPLAVLVSLSSHSSVKAVVLHL